MFSTSYNRKSWATDLELLAEAITAIAELKISHLVTSVPPDTVNSPLVAEVIASETPCVGHVYTI